MVSKNIRREDCGRSEFCRISQDLQADHAGVDMSSINRDGKIWKTGIWWGRSGPQFGTY